MNFYQSTQPIENIFVEDFEDGGSPGFDPFFNHQIGSLKGWNRFSWDIEEPWWEGRESEDTGYFLGLWPAKNLITFDIQPAQQVRYVSVDMLDYGGQSTVNFIGSNGEFAYMRDRFTGDWETFTTENLDIGEIQAVELFSYEGLYDNIAVHVVSQNDLVTSMTVPEPGIMIALGISALSVCLGRMKQVFQHG